jgi:rhamnosyltransferase
MQPAIGTTLVRYYSMQSNSIPPLISVVIPVKNGRATIESCLQGIFSQTLRDQLEVIIIDSGSTDGTYEIASSYPAQLHRISPEQFNHGETRNLGVQLARGQFVVMTVQDATPVDPLWLERTLQHFSDTLVAGVCGLQIVPHEPGKNPLQWTRLFDKPEPRKVYFSSAEEFTQLSPALQHEYCRWDNVNAMYRRSVLLEIPFRRIGFSEDALWARDALSNGYALVYDPRSQVYHYHHETFSFKFRRAYTMQYHTYRYFQHLRPVESLVYSMLRCVYRLWKTPDISSMDKVVWFGHNTQLILASWTAQRLFRLSLYSMGDRGVEQTHAYFCSVSPQSPKSVSPNFKSQEPSPRNNSEQVPNWNTLDE